MKNFMEKKSNKVIFFAILLHLLELNIVALIAICLFIILVDSEKPNFNFGEGILIDERSIIF